MKILLAADHGGYNLKEKIKKVLTELKFDLEDFSPNVPQPTDDYPDIVIPTMQNMQSKPDSKAILFCRNGVGVSILANKYKGIRAGLSFNKEHVTSAREDDNINVLALPSDYIKFDEAVETVAAFLNTPFSNAERHVRRLDKVSSIEK